MPLSHPPSPLPLRPVWRLAVRPWDVLVVVTFRRPGMFPACRHAHTHGPPPSLLHASNPMDTRSFGRPSHSPKLGPCPDPVPKNNNKRRHLHPRPSIPIPLLFLSIFIFFYFYLYFSKFQPSVPLPPFLLPFTHFLYVFFLCLYFSYVSLYYQYHPTAPMFTCSLITIQHLLVK